MLCGTSEVPGRFSISELIFLSTPLWYPSFWFSSVLIYYLQILKHCGMSHSPEDRLKSGLSQTEVNHGPNLRWDGFHHAKAVTLE